MHVPKARQDRRELLIGAVLRRRPVVSFCHAGSQWAGFVADSPQRNPAFRIELEPQNLLAAATCMPTRQIASMVKLADLARHFSKLSAERQADEARACFMSSKMTRISARLAPDQ